MNPILDAAIEYLEMGFSVIPVKSADKKPYIKWTEYQKKLPTQEELEKWWTIWPNANVAILTGSISNLFVVDADGPIGIKWIDENLPKTGVYSVTGKGLHAVFKIPEGKSIKNAVRLAPEVDIRGEGGYIVAPPSVHAIGHTYKWQFVMDGWDDLTEYYPVNGNKQKGNLNLDLSRTSTKLDIKKIAAGVGEGERDTLLYKEACRLRGKNIDEAEAWEILKSFANRCDPPFPEKEALSKLKQAWKKEPNEIETPHLKRVELDEESFPEHLLAPGGVLQDMMCYIKTNSTVSVPIFSLGACLSMLGAIMGQKVQTETGLRTNMYCISLGYSGTGKNSPFSTIPQLIMRSNAGKILGPTELTSAPAILKWLSTQGKEICLILLDEIGSVLKGIKKPDSHQAEIPSLLTKLFTGTDRPEIKSYASADDLIVKWHHLSLYGASTPERFWDSIGGGEVSDGFLARVLLFESKHDAPLPNLNMIFKDNPELVEKINLIYSIEAPRDPRRGNLEMVPVPKMIPRDTEARAFFEVWAKKYHKLKNEHKREGYSSVYGRAAEHAAKIALIHAVSKNMNNVKAVDLESIKYACDLVDYLTEKMVKNIQENIADSHVEKQKQKILKGIKKIQEKTKYGGATLRDIQRGPCQGMLKFEVQKYIESLLLSEQIGLETKKNSQNKDFNVYYVVS